MLTSPSQHVNALQLTLKCFVFCHVFMTYCYTVRPTVGISMAPTLNATGDLILLSRKHRRGRDIEIGDVVTFHHPVKIGEGGLKRVVGMPGDFVLRDTPGKGDGLLLKVSTVFAAKNWLWSIYVGASNTCVKIPEGHCWVAGDNQASSRDSRLFGPLPLALIKGKVIARILPLSQMGWMENSLQSVEAEID